MLCLVFTYTGGDIVSCPLTPMASTGSDVTQTLLSLARKPLGCIDPGEITDDIRSVLVVLDVNYANSKQKADLNICCTQENSHTSLLKPTSSHFN